MGLRCQLAMAMLRVLSMKRKTDYLGGLLKLMIARINCTSNLSLVYEFDILLGSCKLNNFIMISTVWIPRVPMTEVMATLQGWEISCYYKFFSIVYTNSNSLYLKYLKNTEAWKYLPILCRPTEQGKEAGTKHQQPLVW